jgi:hypothetical protein
MKKNNTILNFIFSLIVTIVLIGIFLFILNIIKNKNQHISAVFNTLQEKITEKERADNSKGKIQEIKLLQSSLNQYFIDSNQIDKFVSYLEDIGLVTGAQVTVKGIEVLKKENNLISFKLSANGTFEEVMKTITLLENIPYQIKIMQVYLNKNIDKYVEVTETKKLTSSVWQADISFNILALN